jgi:hypothetical protein
MRAALLVPCALAMLACARGAGPGPPAGGESAQVADSLRGRVEIVGSEPGTWPVLQMDGGRRAVTLDGERPLLDRMAGLEIAVWGEMERPGVFRVRRTAVRASGTVAAVDGVLAREGGGWVLVTGDGKHLPVRHLPSDLEGMEGARVWLAGPLDRPPDSSGILADPPHR